MTRDSLRVTDTPDSDLLRHVSSRKIHCTTLVTMETDEEAKLLCAPDPLERKKMMMMVVMMTVHW